VRWCGERSGRGTASPTRDMFTGLIEEIGVIREVRRERGLRLEVEARVVLEGLRPGDSIAVSGPCITVEQVSGARFSASLLPETAELTTLGAARPGRRVNLERPLAVGDRLGGHFVAGHIDGVAEVVSVETRGNTRLVQLLCPAGLERYLVDQGSVALDGVSLTVRNPAGRRFAVSLVPATLEATTLGDLRVGDRVNMEADLLAKHVEKFVGRGAAERPGDLMEWLAEEQVQP